MLHERSLVQAIELVAVAVALLNLTRAIHAMGQRSRREVARVAAEPHRPAELLDAQEIAQLVNEFRGRVRVALGRIGVAQPGDVACVLNRGPLEAVTDPEVRNAALARDLGRLHHAARSPAAEPSRHENAVGIVEQVHAARFFERLGFDPLDVHFDAVRKSAMRERLVEALVGIFVSDVLADDVDGHVVGGLRRTLDDVFPCRHPAFGLRQVQILEHHAIETFRGEHERDFVNRRDVLRRDNGFLVDVAEQRDLALDVGTEKAIGAAEQDVRLDANRSQIAGRCAASASSSARRRRR